MYVTLPVLGLGPTLAICANVVQVVAGATNEQRFITKPLSLFALSRHVRVTCGPAWAVAVRLVGAAGAVAIAKVLIGPAVLEEESADIVGKAGMLTSPTTSPLADTL